MKIKILLFADQEPPKITVPQSSQDRLKAAVTGKDEFGKNIYGWVAVPDDKGDLYVLKASNEGGEKPDVKEKAAAAGAEVAQALQAGIAKSTGDAPEQAPTALITIEDFSKVKLMTAEVVAAEEVPKADKLLKLILKLGGGPDQEARTKQIVAGIKQFYNAAPAQNYEPGPHKPCILGRTVIIVDNLQPTQLRGIDSFGMLLAVRLPDGSLSLLTTDKPTPSGLPAK